MGPPFLTRIHGGESPLRKSLSISYIFSYIFAFLEYECYYQVALFFGMEEGGDSVSHRKVLPPIQPGVREVLTRASLECCWTLSHVLQQMESRWTEVWAIRLIQSSAPVRSWKQCVSSDPPETEVLKRKNSFRETLGPALSKYFETPRNLGSSTFKIFWKYFENFIKNFKKFYASE